MIKHGHGQESSGDVQRVEEGVVRGAERQHEDGHGHVDLARNGSPTGGHQTRPGRPIGNQQRLLDMATVRSRRATFSVWRKGLPAELKGSTKMAMTTLTSPEMGVPLEASTSGRRKWKQQTRSDMATVRSRWTTFNVWRKGLRAELQGSSHHTVEDISVIFSFLAGLRTVFPQLGALVPPASRADHGPARKPNTDRSPPSLY